MELFILKTMSWLFVAGFVALAFSVLIATVSRISFKKVFVVVAGIITLVSVLLLFTGCEKQDPYPPIREVEVSVDCTDCEWKLLQNDSVVASGIAVGIDLYDSVLYQQVAVGDHFKLLVWTDDTIRYQWLYYLGRNVGGHSQSEDDYWFTECDIIY